MTSRPFPSIARLAVVVALGLGSPMGVDAQDSHYWAEQYGTRAALLGGALIGSVRDLSSTYYNPGATALNPEAGFVLSGRAFRQGTLTLENGAGEGLDLSTSSQRPIPTLLATPIDFDWLGRHALVYSALSRQSFDADVQTYLIDERDAVPAPGDEFVAGAYTANASLRETWTGLTWAYPIREGLGIGVSQYLVLRNQTLGSQALAQAATQAGNVGIATRLRRRSYKEYSTLTKIGLTGQSESFSWGITATTPRIHLKGDGTANMNASAAGVDVDGDGIDDDFLAASVQPGLKAIFRSGWAVGAGTGLQLGATRVHLAAEWFQAVERFTILNAEPVVPQVGAGAITNDMTAEYASVLNWGVGVEQELGAAVLFGGIALDRSAGVPDAPYDTDVVLTTYDLWRYSGGASFRLGRSEIMLGLGWAAGRQPFPNLADIGSIEGSGVVVGNETIDLRYTQWTIVLGFELVRGGDEGDGGQ